MKLYEELFFGDSDKFEEEYFYSIRKNGRDFWFIEEKEKVPSFLATYPKLTPKSKLFSFAIKTIWLLGVQSFFFKKNKFRINDNSIYKKMQNKCKNVSFFVGTPGVNRKIVLVGKEIKENTHFFVKIPTSKDSTLLVRNELISLNKINSLNIKPHKTPRIVSFNGVKAFTEVPCSTSNNQLAYLNNISDYYKMIYNKTKRQAKLLDFLVEELNIELLENRYDDKTFLRLFASMQKLFSNSISKLKTEPDKYVNLYFSHGDFTKWNVFLNESDCLSIIDWEMAGYRTQYFDLIHFFFTDLVFLEKNSLNVTLDIRKLLASKVTGIIDAEDIDFYILIYTLIQVTYYIPRYIVQKGELHEQVYWQMEVWNNILASYTNDNRDEL